MSRPRAFERCEQRFQAKNFGACGGLRPIVEATGWRRCAASFTALSGTFPRVPVRWSGQKLSKKFLLQKWIDLDELNPMVSVAQIVRRRIDFYFAPDELGAIRAVHQ